MDTRTQIAAPHRVAGVIAGSMKSPLRIPIHPVAHLCFLSLALGAILSAQSLSTIQTFTVNAAAETLPPVLLFRGTDGNIYGPAVTAPLPGAALLKVNSDGSLTMIKISGACTPVMQGSDGNFYGKSTSTTLCQMTPNGNATVFSGFTEGLGANFISPMIVNSPIQGSDGSLYGTVFGRYTSSSSATGPVGIIYKLTPTGVLTLLSPFPSQSDEPLPYSTLIQGRDGNFYGATIPGADQGSVFKVTPSGAFTFLHKFSGADGAFPASLVSATDGALYGVTSGGGTSNAGTFFKIDSTGTFFVLYNFQAPPGLSLFGNNATFLQASDGNFYGTSSAGGSNGNADIYQLTTTGAYKVAGTFDPDTTVLSIVNGSDGNIYGVSQVLHPTQILGTIFKLAPGSSSGPASPSVSTAISASSFGAFSSLAPGTWVEIYGANLASDTRSWAGSDFNGSQAPTSLDKTSVTIGGQSAFIDYISPTQVNALLASNTPTGSQQMVVSNPSGATTQYTVVINAVEPGLLSPTFFKIGAVQYVVALFPDGTYSLPTSAIAGINSRPAKPGDTITLYGVGFGAVAPATPAGQLVQQANSLALPLQVTIGGVPATVTYDGLAPGYTGLYQFNLTIPSVPAGNAPLAFTLNGTPGTQTLYIPIIN